MADVDLNIDNLIQRLLEVYHTQKDQVQKKAKLKDIFSSDFVGTQLLHNNNQPPSPSLSLQQQQETTNSST